MQKRRPHWLRQQVVVVVGRWVWAGSVVWVWDATVRSREEASRVGWGSWEETAPPLLCVMEVVMEVEVEGDSGPGWGSGWCGEVQREAEGCRVPSMGLILVG